MPAYVIDAKQSFGVELVGDSFSRSFVYCRAIRPFVASKVRITFTSIVGKGSYSFSARQRISILPDSVTEIRGRLYVRGFCPESGYEDDCEDEFWIPLRDVSPLWLGRNEIMSQRAIDSGLNSLMYQYAGRIGSCCLYRGVNA